FLCGIGLIYAGNLKLGLILFISLIVCEILAPFTLGITGIIAIIIWIYNLVQTYKTVKAQ
ncbi:MAG TPA: hypothetical protein O0W90_04710, partial [Methanocorpusculum sp.]|nr:hypothetical protein [Methanocorpusculum sp.]